MASKPGAIVGYGTQFHIKGPLIMTDAQKAGIPQQPPSANATQVGGEHYKTEEGEQHWDRMWRFYREAWFVGNITKYVERYRDKNGIEDLKKAQHYLQKLIELEEAEKHLRELATHSEARQSTLPRTHL